MNTDTHPKLVLPPFQAKVRITMESCPHCRQETPGIDHPLLKRGQYYSCWDCGRLYDEFLREVWRA